MWSTKLLHLALQQATENWGAELLALMWGEWGVWCVNPCLCHCPWIPAATPGGTIAAAGPMDPARGEFDTLGLYDSRWILHLHTCNFPERIKTSSTGICSRAGAVNSLQLGVGGWGEGAALTELRAFPTWPSQLLPFLPIATSWSPQLLKRCKSPSALQAGQNGSVGWRLPSPAVEAKDFILLQDKANWWNGYREAADVW